VFTDLPTWRRNQDCQPSHKHTQLETGDGTTPVHWYLLVLRGERNGMKLSLLKQSFAIKRTSRYLNLGWIRMI